MYIGNQPYQVAFLTDQFSGNGSTNAFTMSVAPANTSSVLVVVSGVVQDPSTYSVSGTTLTFSQAPPTGTGNISARYLGIPASNVTTTAYRTVTNFTATSGQTTFTPPSYTAGFINVYRNGVYLPTTDYTASNGTTVVLNNGCTTGDTVTVESFLVSSVLNALPQTGGVISGNLTITGIETVGSGSPLGGTTNPIIASVSSSNNYIQTYIYNSTNGSSSSADLVAYPNNGADAHGWVDMGITSQTYADTTYTVTGPNESYLFGSAPSGSSTTGNLVYATDSTGTQNAHQFYVGGFTQAKSAYKFAIESTGAHGQLVSGTAVASTSGTSIDFTGIPSWVKRITVMFNGVSTNGTSNLQVQIGSGSVTSTGYSGGISQAGSTPYQITLTTGLGITASNAAVLSSTGTAVFSLLGSNIWVGTSTTSRSDGYGQLGGTVITLSGTLDRVRITTVNGTDTFDAGSINILYEG